MVIGIKYCGGCNPVYDRVRRVRRFIEENSLYEYVGISANQPCDYWLVVCGCIRRCARSVLVRCLDQIPKNEAGKPLYTELDSQTGTKG
ncbi:hypothetical protein [Clostridium sp. Marseille-P2415]|uniref:hypothetical protein n=1 Tax=Clostridium sp. Marseille-P2415 TaxID=1805471 RepID=UPI0009883AC4|nr:hypothetical protein [Clostridium sp. Marseille-P2415]